MPAAELLGPITARRLSRTAIDCNEFTAAADIASCSAGIYNLVPVGIRLAGNLDSLSCLQKTDSRRLVEAPVRNETDDFTNAVACLPATESAGGAETAPMYFALEDM